MMLQILRSTHIKAGLFVGLLLLLFAAQAAEPTASSAQGRFLEPEMQAIPAGQYVMGDLMGDGEESELPAHDVTVTAFMLSRYEVTVAEFRLFVESTGYRTDAEKNTGEETGCYAWDDAEWGWGWRERNNWRQPGFLQGDKQPVVCVSWHDAQQYIEWLNKQANAAYRLPSEAEWEYVARAGSADNYSFGNNADELCEHANVADNALSPAGRPWENKADCDDGYRFTASVGSFKANDFGVYDLNGNVREWVQDRWHDDYSGAPHSAKAWLTEGVNYHLYRGGAWDASPWWLRLSVRGYVEPDVRASDTGFRLARDR